jgi:hypothetical protein
MRTLSLTDLEQTLAAEPSSVRGPPRGFSALQWVLLAANHLAPVAVLCALSLEGASALAPFFSGSAGYLALAGLGGGLLASAAAMFGLFLLTNRAAPAGASSPRFRALCLGLVWAMTTVLFTAPLCVALFNGQALVSAVGGG